MVPNNDQSNNLIMEMMVLYLFDNILFFILVDKQGNGESNRWTPDWKAATY